MSSDIQGNGAPPADLVISDAPLYDFGQRAIGSQMNHSLTVTNNGGVTATAMNGPGLVAPLDYLGGVYPGTGGDCGLTLAAAATCTLVVNYAPVTLGAHNDTIDIAYFDGLTPQTSSRDLQGEGVNPALLEISEAPIYSFGNQAVGSVLTHSLTLTNNGSFPASNITDSSGFVAPFQYVGGAYPGTGGTCGVDLAVGANCSLVVEFAPVSTGLSASTLELSYEDGALSQTVDRNIDGTGVTPAVLIIDNGPVYDYGTVVVNGVYSETFTVTNTGNFDATLVAGGGLVAPYNFAGGVFPGTAGTCTAVINPGNSCTLVVEFSPVATGIQTDTIDVSYFDGAATRNMVRDLSGESVLPALLEISEAPTFNYGTVAVGSINTHTFIVTNSGEFQATSIADGLGLAIPFQFTGGTFPGATGDCGTTLNVGASCNIDVEYASAVVSSDNDTIELTYFDGLISQTASRDMIGSSVPPAVLTLSESDPFDYGVVAIGATSVHTFILSNSSFSCKRQLFHCFRIHSSGNRVAD